MEKLMYALLDILTSVPQTFLVLWFNTKTVPVISKKVYIISAMLIMYVIYILDKMGYMPMLLRCVLLLFFFTGYICFFIKKKRFKYIVYVMLNYVMIMLNETIFSIIYYFTDNAPALDFINNPRAVVFYRIIFFIIYYLMGSALCSVIKKEQILTGQKYWYIPIFMAEFLIPTVFAYQCGILRLNVWSSVINFIINIIIVIMLIVTYVFLRESEKRESEYYKTRMLSIQMTEQKKREAELTEQIDKAEEIRNNIINGLTHAQSLLAGEKVKDACSYLGGIVDGLWQNSMYSTNKVVDAVVSSKAKICAEKNIDFECGLPIADDVSGRGIKNAELCAVFANLLDNGIRACNGVEQALDEHNSDMHTRPFIRLYAKEKGGYLSIRQENSYDENSQVRKKEGVLPEHGLGLGIIESLAKEHDGRLKTEINDGVYITRVTLKMI